MNQLHVHGALEKVVVSVEKRGVMSLNFPPMNKTIVYVKLGWFDPTQTLECDCDEGTETAECRD